MGTDTTHQCPAPGCRRRVPRVRLACGVHWYKLPRPIRSAVHAAYRKGDVTAHVAAMQACEDYWRRNP